MGSRNWWACKRQVLHGCVQSSGRRDYTDGKSSCDRVGKWRDLVIGIIPSHRVLSEKSEGLVDLIMLALFTALARSSVKSISGVL